MTVFITFLRAVNVGGTGLLPMKDLSTLCSGLGLQNVRTYIQSGNVVFESERTENEVKVAIETALAERMGKNVDVMCRSASELRSILDANPFPEGKPAQVAVVFLAGAAPKDALDRFVIPGREEIRVAGREIYIHYPDGMGRSKLRFPLAMAGTARNLNTIAKLVVMAGA